MGDDPIGLMDTEQIDSAFETAITAPFQDAPKLRSVRLELLHNQDRAPIEYRSRSLESLDLHSLDVDLDQVNTLHLERVERDGLDEGTFPFSVVDWLTNGLPAISLSKFQAAVAPRAEVVWHRYPHCAILVG